MTAFRAAEAVVGTLQNLPPRVAHTAALVVLWTVWKARNAVIFNGVNQPAIAMACALQEHINLWVCRAPRRLNFETLKLWCQTVVDVN
ncbi:hypothetical protein HU200_022951 [Digitaria exilis]|uniref:Uncharacterized protein n=1 Tax=Digitaria exilis TaxID=1010633 RepID=A0A835CDC9_9POAL|nr:hypothetical protein HU200_022951 [Digitaria exilis]